MYSPQQASVEHHVAAAHRHLALALRAADGTQTLQGTAEDLRQLLIEVERVSTALLRPRYRRRGVLDIATNSDLYRPLA
jgi:hypothetical protein